MDATVSRAPTIATITSIAERALARVGVSADAAVVLEGSLAEGFGNARSDIDLLVLDESEARPVVRTLVFVEEHRVEVHFRSTSEHLEIAERVNAVRSSESAALRRLGQNDLDLYQRFANSVTVRNANAIQTMKSHFTIEQHGRVATLAFRTRAKDAFECASIMDLLGEHEEAITWAKKALVSACKAWCATRGESYIANKWLGLQLERAGMDEKTRAQLWSLVLASERETPAGSKIAGFVRAIDTLDVGYGARANEALVERDASTSSWTLDGSLYILVGEDVFYHLSPAARRVWDRVTGAITIQHLVDGDSDPARAGVVVACLHRAGLISFRRVWRAGRWTRHDPPRAWNLVPSQSHSRDADVQLVRMPARDFVARGVSLFQSVLAIDIIQEDMVGALLAHQWSVFEFQLQRATAVAAQLSLAANGLSSSPPEELIGTCLQASGHQDLLREYRALNELRVHDSESAEGAATRFRSFVDRVQAMMPSGRIGQLFRSESDWKEGMEAGRNWSALAVKFGIRAPDFVELAIGRDAYAFERAGAWASTLRHTQDYVASGVTVDADRGQARQVQPSARDGDALADAADE